MTSNPLCPLGHSVAPGQSFCGTCGARVADVDSPQSLTPDVDTSPSSRSLPTRLVLISTLAAVAVAALILFVVARGGGSQLSVVIGDNMSEGCDEYTESRFVGGNLTLTDASGDIVDTVTISGSGTVTDGDDGEGSACIWTVNLNDVPDSSAYGLRLRLPAGTNSSDPIDQELTYSRSELESKSWNLELLGNR